MGASGFPRAHGAVVGREPIGSRPKEDLVITTASTPAQHLRLEFGHVDKDAYYYRDNDLGQPHG